MFIATTIIRTPITEADVVDGAFVAAAEVAEDNNEDEGSVVKPEGLLVAADEGTTVVDNCTVEDVVICTALVDEDVTCATEELLDVVTTIDSVEDVVGGKAFGVDVVRIDGVECVMTVVWGGRVCVVDGGGGGGGLDVVVCVTFVVVVWGGGGGGLLVVVCCSVLLEELSAPDPDWAIPLGQVLAPEEKDPF
ncbi:hypothetical protein GYMLUDRAFT_62000 [Collybiopsis luxurians FD-317 M1]|uniref:Uncharacterized protein n=1 Tax=Collybiopsis luxurians FD-317 M1 TaxID=944289 RepID=A0A0D0C205_9AGAR|nr:hypothetical protein GYMLUDRAFT_62000 [Collybiopsis luxurians FD-317 M1]